MSKEKFLEIIKKPVFIAVAGVVLGLVLGLAIGWGIWPVQWTDASAESLRPDLQRDFLRNAIVAYEKTGDQVKAVQLFNELGDYKEQTLSELVKDQGFLNIEQLLKFSQVVSAESAVIEQPIEANDEDGIQDTESKIGKWLPIILGILLVGAAVLVYFIFIKDKIPPKHKSLAEEVPETSIQAEVETKTVDMVIPGKEKPVAQFMTTYMFGDDLYDDSFTFDAPNGEFLGECGVSIGDTIGVGEPKKISAFEVWLFDKNDVQTVTKLFLSEHIFNEVGLRGRLESKGEPILAESGKQILLETATLQLEARIVDMNYGEIPLPENSYFQRFTLELAIWRK